MEKEMASSSLHNMHQLVMTCLVTPETLGLNSYASEDKSKHTILLHLLPKFP